MPLDTQRTRQYLKAFEFRPLFSEEMGWERYASTIHASVDGLAFDLTGIAEKRGLVAFLCSSSNGRIPDYATRRKIEAQVTKTAFEHIIIYADAGRTTQVWQWVKREAGKPAASREHTYHVQQTGEALIQKLQAIVFSLEEEESLTTVSVAGRVRAAFDVERITKRFYDRFKTEHDQFLTFTEGIPDKEIQRWYASVMINRLMFIYFIQKKGFLDSDTNYLGTRLNQSKRHGRDLFYSDFLCPLFFEGFAKKETERSASAKKLLGKVPYLNGGLFLRHQIEEKHGHALKIRDSAFAKLFDFFDGYQWHLDERPLRQDNEINPDVLGYIFEKYINQKQMGAYYTKEDITDYIGKNAIIPFLFEKASEKCRIAFEGDHSIWQLLQADPDRYIYDAMKKGVDLELPNRIADGVDDVSKRIDWNKQAPGGLALPTEIWREVISRRKQYEEIRMKLAAGQIRSINELITNNLDIRQFAQDIIEGCEGPDLLNAFWHATEKMTVLDPTCGSGAFLFAALNILEPLYEASLDRMEVFLEEWGEQGKKVHPNYHRLFSDIRKRLEQHPNRRYFILKSIIINNLFGVDIMEEATEICKLRLFLKLVAQVERDEEIEPLPDIDFNIRAGNTLVGYATYESVRKAGGDRLDFEDAMVRIEEKAQDVDRLFALFRQQQTELGGNVTSADKHELRKRLKVLEDELNEHLAIEYGVKSNKTTHYNSWLEAYRPFHWLIEFHDILKSGGFDVIIGNPPYLEYSKVKDYRVRSFATVDCRNLYAFTVERSFTLSDRKGRVSMIIPISVACSGAMEPLRKLLLSESRSLWLSHYSNRPGQLFTGAQNRLTIIVTSSCNSEPGRFSTKYHRWDARNGERDNLFPTIRYEPLKNNAIVFHGLLPKVGCPEASSTLEKIQSKKTVGLLTSRHGRHKLYWVRVPGYFCQFLPKPPMARPEKGGKLRIRGEVNSIALEDGLNFRLIHAILNSSTYYQFFCAFTDTRHINPSDVSEFPLDLTSFAKGAKLDLSELFLQLSLCNEAHTSQRRKSGLLIDSIDSSACKPILDRVDGVLAHHYNFTAEELDFIINYDIKYRMGLSGEPENEE